MLSPFMISEPHHRSEIGKVKVGKLLAGHHEVSQPRPAKRPCGQTQAVAGRGGFAAGAAPDTVLQGPFQALWSDSGRQTGPRRSKSVLLPPSSVWPCSCFRQTRPTHTSTHTKTTLTTDVSRLVPTGQWRCGPHILQDPFSDDSDPPKHGPHPQPTHACLTYKRRTHLLGCWGPSISIWSRLYQLCNA